MDKLPDYLPLSYLTCGKKKHLDIWMPSLISFFNTCTILILIEFFVLSGYGFVDFENPQDASIALKNLQAQNMQVQMAKVSVTEVSYFITYTCIATQLGAFITGYTPRKLVSLLL